MLSVSAGPFLTTPHRLFFLLALVVALLVGWICGRRQPIAVQPVLNQMVVYGLLSARIVFVLVYLGEYWREPWRMLDIRDGGFFYEASAVTAVGIGWYHAWRQPRIRHALGLAVASGLLVWGAGMGLFHSMIAMQPQVDELPLTTLDGQPQSLAAMRGKPVVVNLWATWCPPCRREMPVLAEAQQREQQIEFAFINQGETSATVGQYLHREGLQLDNVFLDIRTQWSRDIGAAGMPTTLFFDAEGMLVGSHTGELSSASLKLALRRFLNQ